MMHRKHRDFINFVIKDWVSEMTTETSVTLEFMDKNARSSYVS